MSKTFVQFNKDGQPLGWISTDGGPSEAEQNRPGCEALPYDGPIPPDLSGKWVEDGKLVDRDKVKTKASKETIAAFEAEQARAQTLADLAATDIPFIRATEDLIGTLITKGVLSEEDIPQPVRDKIKARESLRADLNG